MGKKDLVATIIIRLLIFFIFISIVNVSVFPVKADLLTNEVFTSESLDDIQITFAANQTTIGRKNGVLANLTLANQGENTIGDIAINFDFDSEYALFSPTYSPYQESSYLDSQASISFLIEMMLNDSVSDDDLTFTVADVCLVFDSSGSMGNEINDVKQEFLALTDRLTDTIPSLRFAMIVYGWTRYSEYPTANSNNYLDFTDNYEDVNAFISQLSASGGTEPWGDALYLANTFAWREDIPKLLIIVGDEDCDPGLIVGKGQDGSYYNGSQLVDAVQNLKDTGVVINSIMTDPSDMVENQFTWIAEYTGGEMIDLMKLNSEEGPAKIPELIEEMTLSMIREYFINLTATISLTEFTSEGDVDYTTEEFVYIMIDFAPPSISVSTLVMEELDSSYSLLVSVTPLDFSGIMTTQIIWTDDDLSINPDPIWDLSIPETVIGDTYIQKFTDLVHEQKFSFYALANDNNGNTGTTEIYNLTIVNSPKDYGSTTEFAFIENNSYCRIYFVMSQSQEGYLWIRANDTIGLTFEDQSNFESMLVYMEGNYSIYQIEKMSDMDSFLVLFSGNISTSTIKIRWNLVEVIDQSELYETSWLLDEYRTNVLIKVGLWDPDSGYLSLLLNQSPLIAKAHVYHENWTKVGIATAGEALYLNKNGTYYIWVDRVIRFGEFKLYYDIYPWEDYDPYYGLGWGAATGIPYGTLFTFLVISIISLILYLTRKKRRNC